MRCSPTPQSFAIMVMKWNLAKITSKVIRENPDPMDDVMLVEMAKASSGLRGGGYLNHRLIYVTVKDYHAVCQILGKPLTLHECWR